MVFADAISPLHIAEHIKNILPLHSLSTPKIPGRSHSHKKCCGDRHHGNSPQGTTMYAA
jgi:hypothetical protein